MEVGYPLTDIAGTKELVHGIRCAFEGKLALRGEGRRAVLTKPSAALEAFKLHRRLHRDISVGNIVLVWKGNEQWRAGILIDWEMSSVADENGFAQDSYHNVSSMPNTSKRQADRRFYREHGVSSQSTT